MPDMKFLRSDSRCRWYVSDLFNVSSRYLASESEVYHWGAVQTHAWLPCSVRGRSLILFWLGWGLISGFEGTLL